MLVNGVLVKEISNDAAPNFFEIGKYFAEESNLVHREQRVVDAFSVLHHVQNQPARFRMVGKQAIGGNNPLPNSCQRCGVEPSFLAMRFRKRFDHVKWIRKIGWDTDAARTPDYGLFPKAGLTGNLACLEEIITHQIFRGLASLRIFVAEFLCDLLLKFKGQNVEITAGVEM